MASDRPAKDSLAPLSVALRLVDFGLPSLEPFAEGELRTRGRLVIILSGMLVLTAAFFLVHDLVTGGIMGATIDGAIAVGAIAIAANPLLLRFTGALEAASALLLLELLATLTFIAFTGQGIWDQSLWWLVTVPVFATFLLGVRAGMLACFAVVGELIVAYQMTMSGQIGRMVPTEESPWFIVICASTVVLALTSIAWAYEQVRDDARSDLDEKLRQLEAANRELGRLRAKAEAERTAVETRSEAKTRFLHSMDENATVQGTALDEAGHALGHITRGLRGIEENVRVVRDAAAVSERAIEDVRQLSERMAGSGREMAERVSEVASSVQQLTGSADAVAVSVRDLSGAARDTEQSMRTMEQVMSEVERTATATVAVFGDVRTAASSGSSAVQRTLEGMGEIQGSSRAVSEAIEDLSEQMKRIGQILDVIDEVTTQTQMLSLNASILASQAGPHGRGFAVIADEIKKLSSRTGESTKEIGSLIEVIRARTDRAVNAIAHGEKAVDSGMSVSRNAAVALDRIMETIAGTADRVASLAAGGEEQTREAREVAKAMQRVSRIVQRVEAASAEQAHGARIILESAERLRALSDTVQKATADQARGSREVTDAIAHIHATLEGLMVAHSEQARGAESIHASIEEIHERQLEQVASIRSMAD